MLLSGNEAVALGAWQAGCSLAAAYPGTPSSEILPALMRWAERRGGDIYCEWDFQRANQLKDRLAHLVMVANPAHHAGGDFCLQGEHVRFADGQQTLTYAGIGVFSPDFFAEVKDGQALKLRPLLDAAIATGTLTGEEYTGCWVDVGTPERLAELDRSLKEKL